jgi:predicted RND superfamily exporter protein
VATSIFCAVTLGIGVDYGVHFLEQYQRAEAAGEARPALVAAAEAGPAILVDALAISLGFGLLAVSRVPANSRLGLLVAVGLASACLLTLAGEGSLLAWLGRRHRLRSASPATQHQPETQPALAEEAP